MKYATYRQAGRRCLGIVSDDGQSVRRLPLPPEQVRGVLAVLDLQRAGEKLVPTGDPVPPSLVTLQAPVPLPHRTIWCVGRNCTLSLNFQGVPHAR